MKKGWVIQVIIRAWTLYKKLWDRAGGGKICQSGMFGTRLVLMGG
jgi:hypothetical protein